MPRIGNYIEVNPFSYILTDLNPFGGYFLHTMLAIKADGEGITCKTYDGKIRHYNWSDWFVIRERYEIQA